MKYREFDDVEGMRRNILDKVREATASRYPVENDRFILELDELEYDTEAPASLRDQKKAIMEGGSLSHKLKGHWVLRDKETGEVVDEKRTIVAHVPMATQRGTFVFNGNEYTVNSQLRLRSGPYSRKKDNGGLETHFNMLPGSGSPAFRVHLEPETGIFKMQLGQSHLPMYPILHALGVPDERIEKAWGKELFAANRREDPAAVRKAYERFVRDRQPDEAPEVGLRRTFSSLQMDEEIVNANLGRYLPQQNLSDIGRIPMPSLDNLGVPDAKVPGGASL